jgi:hypothetical protein
MMAMIELFNRQGKATAFCDGQSIYLWDGSPVAYLLDDNVFAFSGRFIGWLSDGWITDDQGKCLLFEPDAVRGPGKPQRQDKPAKGVPQAKPPRGALQTPPAHPAGSTEWSDHTFVQLVGTSKALSELSMLERSLKRHS